MPTTSEILRQSQARIRSELNSLRAITDKRFARFLDFVAGSVDGELQSMLSALDIGQDGQILRTGRNLRRQRVFLLQARSIYSEALGAIEARNPVLFAPYTQAAERARRSVASLSRRMQDTFIFPEINLAGVERAWEGVGVSIQNYTANMERKVTSSVARHMLTGSPVKKLEADLADLSRTSDELIGKNRSDGFHRGRARMQIRGEMNRAYNQQMQESARVANMTLFEHFGPIDPRNVVRLEEANIPGVVSPRFRQRGSAAFIQQVLDKSQWQSVVPTALVYGLHYGERGGFQPINPQWPGQADRHARSERLLGFAAPQEPDEPKPAEPEPEPPKPKPRRRRGAGRHASTKKSRAALAKAEGVDPEAAEMEAQERFQSEREIVEERRSMHREARKRLGITAGRRIKVSKLVAKGADVHTLQNEGFPFDQVGEELASEVPHLLGAEDPAADLFDFVTQPMPERLGKQVLDEFHSSAIFNLQRQTVPDFEEFTGQF